MNDFRFSLRMLAKHRAANALAIVVLSLGIGASSAVFSIVNAILLRPLPGIAASGRLVGFHRTQKSDAFNNFGYPDYADYRDRNRSFSGLVAHCPAPLNLTSGASERVRGDAVTGNYFEVLGVQ